MHWVVISNHAHFSHCDESLSLCYILSHAARLARTCVILRLCEMTRKHIADKRVCCCRHHSVRGVQLWAASRMVELTFKRFMMMCSGTWAINYYMRALGAKIGDWSTFRLGLCLPLLPDSLELGSGCVLICLSRDSSCATEHYHSHMITSGCAFRTLQDWLAATLSHLSYLPKIDDLKQMSRVGKFLEHC